MNSEQWERHADEILGWLRKAVEFAGDQAPLVVQEMLRWRLIEHTVWGVLFSLVAAALLLMVWRLCRRLRSDDLTCRDEDSCWAFLFANGLGSAVSGLLAVYCWVTVVKIQVAPRLYLLEQISKMLGGDF